MKLRKKKGFTIIELVIVIAVIGVLTAVLVPTFVNLTQRANQASDQSLVKNLNTAMAAQEGESGKKNSTYNDAITYLDNYGYRLANLATKAGEDLLWNSKSNRFLLNNTEAVEADKIQTGAEYVDYWTIKDAIPEGSKYSIYAGLNFQEPEGGVAVTGIGFDAGSHNFSKINYTNNSSAQEVVIRTNGANTTLTINAEHDTVNHYGNVGKVDAQKIDMDCYNEYGTAAYVKVTEGKVVAKAGGTIEVVFAANNDKDAVAVIKETNGTIERGLTVIEPVSTTNEARTNGIPLEYSIDGVTAASKTAEELANELETREAAVEEIAQEAINTAIENTVFAGVAVTKSGEATQLMTLVEFANAVNAGNSYAGYTIKLLDNIDLSNIEWTPINGFAGTFDGNYKTLSGLKLNVVTGTGSSDEKHIGFFEKTENATIKNLTISDFEVYGTGRIATATLIGNAANGLTLSNVTLTSSNKLTGKWSGGLVGKITTTKVGSELRDCKYIFTNCHSSVEITGERVGGFIGFVGGSDNTIYRSNGFAIFNGCSFNGKLNANTGTAMAGGFTAQFGTGNRYNLTYVYQNCEVDNTNITSTGVKGDFSASSQSGYSIYNCKVNDVEVTLPTQINFAFSNSTKEDYLFAINGGIYVAWAVNEGYYNIPLTTIGESVKYSTGENNPVQLSNSDKDKTSWHKVSNAFVDFNANIIMEVNENTLYKGNPPVNIEEGSKLQQRKYIAGWDATNNIHVYNFDMWRVVPSDTAETEDWMDTLVLGVGEYFQDPTDYVNTELYNITSFQSESNNTVYVVVAK